MRGAKRLASVALGHQRRGVRRGSWYCSASYGGTHGVTWLSCSTPAALAGMRWHAMVLGGMQATQRDSVAFWRPVARRAWFHSVAVCGGTWLPTVHSMALGESGWLAMHAAVRAGDTWRPAARWHSAVLGSSRCCARVGARARGGMHRDTRWRAVVLMSVGGIWHSAALGSTRRRAVARIVALGDALQRTVELGGRGGTRWHAACGIAQ
jgi:hypothetical protein